jgi:hypothetical protein
MIEATSNTLRNVNMKMFGRGKRLCEAWVCLTRRIEQLQRNPALILILQVCSITLTLAKERRYTSEVICVAKCRGHLWLL